MILEAQRGGFPMLTRHYSPQVPGVVRGLRTEFSEMVHGVPTHVGYWFTEAKP